jgi:hypothetical protein
MQEYGSQVTDEEDQNMAGLLTVRGAYNLVCIAA